MLDNAHGNAYFGVANGTAPLKNKKNLIEIYCIKKCLLDLDPI